LGQGPIGVEGPVPSSLVPQENNRNNQKQEENEKKWRERITPRNKPGRKRYCGSLSLVGHSLSGGEIKYLRVDCKCWDCDHCARIRAKAYRHAIRNAASEHRLSRLLTLTLDPKKIEGDPIRYLRGTFNKFRVYLGRKYGSAPKYIAVVELQKSGNPHLHILIDRFIEQAWVKQAWQAIGGGYKVDIRYVDVHRVSRYVSKYLTDDLLFSAPAGTRRITCSRSVKLLSKPAKTHTWKLYRTTIFHLYGRLFTVAADPEFDRENFLKAFSVNPNKRKCHERFG
jgi:hypothetical protein